MLTIVDHGSGNIGAIARLCRLAAISYVVSGDPEQVVDASHVLLPGVGAIDTVMDQLNSTGLTDALRQAVQTGRTMVLGICVGMQALSSGSEEGQASTLDLIPGRVWRFDPVTIPVSAKLPHMGWNGIEASRPSPLLAGVDHDRGFYFLHSYFFDVADRSDSIAQACHGVHFDAVVNRGTVYGVQFHPEKSHSNGMQLLKNFSEMSAD